MKERFHIPVCLLALLQLCGCGLYGGYERRLLDYDAARLCAADSSAHAMSAVSWRQLFADSRLAEWIDSGLARNTDLRITKLKTDEAAATLSASRLAFLPEARLSAEGSVAHDAADRFSIGPSASWELDVFGRQRNLKKGAEAAFYGSEAYRQAVQSSLVAAIANGYYTLMMLDEQLSISERTLKTWDENIRVLQALKRAGRTNEAAVLQARANRMSVENSTVTLRSQIAVQENAIRSLLLDPDMALERGRFADQSFPETLSKGIALEALSNRPDVREAEYRLQQAFYNVNVARSAFYPAITLSGNLGWTTSSGAVANPSAWIANAVGAVVAPLFSRGTNKANLKIAEAEYEIARLQFQQKLFDAGMEANNALIAWQTATERVALDKKQVVALRGAVHNTRLLMRNSNTNYLEVLTAQQRLLEAELTEASDRYAAIQAIINIYHAIGGGAD